MLTFLFKDTHIFAQIFSSETKIVILFVNFVYRQQRGYTGPLKSYFTSQYFKCFFFTFHYTGWSMFYHTCNLIPMPFGFKKSYQRIMRQYLNIDFKCIPTKTQQQTLKHSNENTTALYAYIIKSVFRCSSLCFNKICNSPLHSIVKFFNGVWLNTIPCFTYSFHPLFYTVFGYQSLSSLYMKFKSCEFPGNLIMAILLHSRNV